MWLALVRASRVTYVGELGWELYVPTEFALGVYDAADRGPQVKPVPQRHSDRLRFVELQRSRVISSWR